MPNAQLTNPKGSGAYPEPVSTGAEYRTYATDPNAAALKVGNVVELLGYNGTASTATPITTTYPVVVASATTGDHLVVGVVVGGAVAGQAPIVGGVVLVCVSGLCQVLIDATSAVGDNLIQSAAHAGNAKTGTAASSLNIGTALQALTYVATSLLCWCNVKLS